ncbi:MAG: hypothetical protein RI884_816 [Pseudomonadota bacterium]|jgi:uncharacterized protein YcfJ
MTIARPRIAHALALAAPLGLALATFSAHGQELARVLSSVAVIQQVTVPRQVCTTQQVAVEQPRSGAGALLGAVAGGAAGNAIGDGSGRAAATMIGIVGGAILGNKIEGSPGTRLQDQTTCSTQNFYENRTVGYNVTYEYAGRQYQVQLPQDPGPTLRVQVTPAASPAPLAPPVQVMQGPDLGPVVVYSTGPAPAVVHRVVTVRPAVVQLHGTYGVYSGHRRHGYTPLPHAHGFPHPTIRWH